MTTEALAVPPQQPPQDIALHYEWSMEQVIARVSKVREVMQKVMKEGDHYGTVPGTNKPSLLKPGAELLCLVFRLDPQYESVEAYEPRTMGDAHLTIKSRCTLWHVPTSQRLGSGEGSCSSKESKYAYRNAKRKCPKCGVEQINKSKFPPKGAPEGTEPGWYCYAKVGGCGAEFAADAPDIVEQQVGRVPNEDIADQYNTVLKMANKRSLVAAVLNVTAASEIFTQDVEDMPAEQLAGRPSASPATPAAQQQERREPRQNPDNVITEPQRKRLWAIAKEHGWTEDDIRKLSAVYRYESLRDIRAKDYDLMVNDIKRGPGMLADGNGHGKAAG